MHRQNPVAFERVDQVDYNPLTPRSVAPITWASEHSPPGLDVIVRLTDAIKLVARTDPGPVLNRPQEIFAPELATPTGRVFDAPRPTGSDAGHDTTGGCDAHDRGDAASPTIVARTFRNAPIGARVQEMWSPELCTPVSRIVEEPRLLVSAASAALLALMAVAAAASATIVVPVIAAAPIRHERQEMFAPELAAPIKRRVEAPPLPVVAGGGPETSGSESGGGGGADLQARVAAAIWDDTIRDLGRLEREDPLPVVDAPCESFAPEPSANIALVVDAPHLLVSDAGRDASSNRSDMGPGSDLWTLVATAIRDDAIRDLGRVERDDSTLAVDALDEFFAPAGVVAVTRVVEASRLQVSDPIDDLGRVEYDDSNLAVDTLSQFFAPEGATSITLVPEEPRLFVSDDTCDMAALETYFGGLAESRGTENANTDLLVAVDAAALTPGFSDIQRAALEFQRFAEGFHTFTLQCRDRSLALPIGCQV